MPANAGIQYSSVIRLLGPRLRGDDNVGKRRVADVQVLPGELGRAAYGSNVRAARRQHAEMLAYITLQSEDTDDRCAAHQPR